MVNFIFSFLEDHICTNAYFFNYVNMLITLCLGRGSVVEQWVLSQFPPSTQFYMREKQFGRER